ncbi:MAG TPA: ATP synthase F1 subunit gamma [Gemmatimonadales bacterium]|jgi:F-type H+-transporting ATPase subunit gamma|nr:ATP synthase F1 subunit gamma [Gemmatimonadales bacterium]
MAKSRQLRGRIRSVRNTRKITRTMELVSTSKLKRAQDRVIAARPYAQALRDTLIDLLTPELAEQFPLLRPPKPIAQGGPNRAAVVLITSNRGLCGSFNANLIKEARRRVEQVESAGYTADLYAVGKKGAGYFKYAGWKLASERHDIGDKPTPDHAVEVGARVIAAYETGQVASVDLVFARFQSALSTPPTIARILPIEVDAHRGAGRAAKTRPDYILAPSAEAILAELLPLYVRNMIYQALVETAASEHGARRTAMKNATDNADELIKILTRTFNRQRQAQITQEIAEIVGGAAALQG